MSPQSRKLGDQIRQFIRQFTPSWFAVIMGTGIIGILVNNLPYGGNHMRDIISLIILILNAFLFVCFIGASIARYLLFPQIWGLMLQEPVQSLFLSCFPMALSTIINASVLTSRRRTDLPGLMPILWSLWWIDVVLAMASCILLPYIMVTRHQHTLEEQNATWLLPVVAPIVAASCGGVIATALIDSSPSKAAVTVGVSCFLLVTGFSLAMMLTTTYLTRLVAYGFPKGGLLVSLFLPLGQCGQGGFALLILSRVLSTLMSAKGVEGALYAKIGIAVAISGALVLWTIGLWFAIISAMGLLEATHRSSVPFKVNFWGMIFPWGVYSLLTLRLGEELDLVVFRVLGIIFSGFTTVLWSIIAAKTLYFVYGGSIFHDPCLDDSPSLTQWRSRPTQDTEITQLPKDLEESGAAHEGNGNSTR